MLTRRYRPEDCAALAKLFYDTVHTVNSAHYTKEQLDVWATKDIDLDKWNKSFLINTTFVVEVNSQIVGFADMNNSGYLDRLYVHKDYQGKGIATELITHLEFIMRKENVTCFETYASITARPFFEKMGYTVEAENIVERDGILLKNFKMIKSSTNEFIIEFWKTATAQDKAKLREFFSEDAIIKWHCTNECFNLDEYIIANCEYPGNWNGEVERIVQNDNLVITVVRVWSEEMSCHVNSFFKIKNDKIVELDEYYGDDDKAPKWRIDKHIGTNIK